MTQEPTAIAPDMADRPAVDQATADPTLTLERARLLANVNYKAQRLYQDGYRARWMGKTTLVIDSPTGGAYTLELDVRTDVRTCDCPFFQRNGHRGECDRIECKHLMGVDKLLADQDAARLHRKRMWEDAR